MQRKNPEKRTCKETAIWPKIRYATSLLRPLPIPEENKANLQYAL